MERSAPEHVVSIDAFTARMFFPQNRDLADWWNDMRPPGDVPSAPEVDLLEAVAGPDYLYLWASGDGDDDLRAVSFGPRLAEYLGARMRGQRLGEILPGARAAGLRADLLRCLSEPSAFCVMRDRHPFPEQWSGNEEVALPVRRGDGPLGLLMGNIVPFAPARIAHVIRPAEARVNVGHRFRPPDLDAAA